MHIPDLGFFKLIDERIGRWATTTLVVLAVIALAVSFAAVIWALGIKPIVALTRELVVRQSLPAPREFVAIVLSGLIFAGFTAITWRVVVVPTARRLNKAFAELNMAHGDFQRATETRVDDLAERVRRLENPPDRRPRTGY